ncbi:MAG: ATP-binding protein [Eubacteriales bacterium]|nr:ATP-binding protein [Eubacteriales bacterium]
MKRIKPDTIIKKSCYLILGIGLAAALLIRLIMPVIFYDMLTPYISQHISSMLRASTISQSYIWQGNSLAYVLYGNDELKEDIRKYNSADSAKIKKTCREQILSRLDSRKLGNITHQIPGKGAIVCNSYSMVCTEWGDAFYLEEASDVADILLNSGWLSTLSADMDMVYSPVLGDDSLQVICFVMPFVVDKAVCYAIHIMDFSYILNLFREMEEDGIVDFAILQNENILYQNTDYRFDMDAWPDYMFRQLQYETSVFSQKDGMDFMTLCSYEGENMKIAAHADRETLLAPYQTIMILIEFLLYGIIFTLVLSIILIIRHLLLRLTVLSQRIDRVNEGNYTPLPADEHHDEIGSLTRNFNRMVENIQFNLDRQISQEKMTQQMQYSLLVSALDPHFIYNTLNTITFLAHMGKTDEITKVNTALIGTLKDRLAIKNCKNYDTIITEKEILTQYMVIQSYLCHNTIDYQFEVDDDDQELLIPKNILQPLVENSIKHGLLPHKDLVTHQILDGKIHIEVKRNAKNLLITIADNGIGISSEDIYHYFDRPVREITEKDAEHIGIYNIRKRLSYLLGSQYEILAESKKGCIISLSLPIITSEPVI